MADKTYEELLSAAGFPEVAAWASTTARVGKHSQERNDLWGEWAGGWNALVYRYLGAHDESERLRESLDKPSGDAPSPVERYRQEHGLFCFYAAALSSLDTFAYAMNVLGAWLRPDAFPLATEEDKRTADVRNVTRRFTEHFPDESVTTELKRLRRSSEFTKLRVTRNILSHRASPGRTIYAMVGAGPTGRGDRPADWMGAALSSTGIRERERSLGRRLGALVRSADDFATRCF